MPISSRSASAPDVDADRHRDDSSRPFHRRRRDVERHRNIDVEIRNPSNQVVGTNLPAGCESTASRTEHVLFQGVLPAGIYRVMLTASNCGSASAPASIATAVSVQSDSGHRCNNDFVSVPVGTTVQGCQFTLP